MHSLTPDELARRLNRRPPSALDDGSEPRWAAVAAVLRSGHPHGWELLFIKRAEHERDPWSGHMAFPGGRVDQEDPHPLFTAVREVREEVGLDLETHGTLLAQLDDLPAMARGRGMGIVVRPFVFVLESDPPSFQPDPSEVDELVWIPLSWLLSDESRDTYVYVHEGTPIELASIRFGAYVIWGMTYKMLHELLERLGQAD